MHDFYQKQQEIRNAFNSVHDTYDNYSEIQQKIGSELIDHLLNINKCSYKNILDLGCGTGLTTQKLLKSIFHDKSYACDFAQNLLFLASKRLENFGTVLHNSDFHYALNKKNYYDLIFSNMSFQWCLDIKILLNLIYQNLKMGGILCFSIPLNGTFKNLPSQSKNTFYNCHYFNELFNQIGYKAILVKEKNIARRFSSFTEAVKSIKYTGANVLIDKNKMSRHFIFDKKLVKSEFKLNYNIGFFIVKK
ncbi:MAG: methyltransferase domain-containing protein [Rickettsiales bacterium]|nr:methyltransferase domain-containing protein [Rickettsiales bacterium]